jgi:hypothetical protein
MLVAGRTATYHEGCFKGLACEAVGKGKGNTGHGGGGGEHRAKDARFGTSVHQIYGIQPDETGSTEGGGHTPHREMEPDRTNVMNMYQIYHFSVVKMC